MATLVEKNIKLDRFEIIKYQIMNHCFVHNIWLNETQLICLTLLGAIGPIQISDFWKIAVDKKLQKNPIGVNNVLRGLLDKKLAIKQINPKKLILLNPELEIQTEGNIVINIKLYKLEGKKTTGNIPSNIKKVEFA